MNDERWQELKDKVDQRFGGFELETSEDYLEDDLGQKIPQKTESMVFESPLGKIRINRTAHPKIIDRKSHYHKGAGGSDIEYVVSEDEMSYKIVVFKKDEVTGDWEPFDLPPEKMSF